VASTKQLQKLQQQAAASKKGAQKASAKENAQPQKKLKANDGSAVAVEKEKREKYPAMLTKLDSALQSEIEERRRERDRRSLFIKNMPRNTTDEEIKALSPDIIHVNRKSSGARWCWISFANEQVCSKNHEKLKKAKMGANELSVDYCGEKSQGGQKGNLTDNRVDALRLYVGNMPKQTKVDELKSLFPTSKAVVHRSDRTFAFVVFDSPETARKAFEGSKNLKVNGQSVVVAYARIFEKERKPKKDDAVQKFAKKQASG